MKRVFIWVFICSMLIVYPPLGSSDAETDLMASAGVIRLDGKKNAPDFSLKDLEGGRIRLKDYRGKVVLMDFWGTW